MGPGSGYYMMGGSGMWFFPLIFIILFVVVIFYLFKQNETKTSTGSSNESALDILKKRYAKGEISKDEYESMKKELI